jgi:hypothetical protein
MTHQDGSVSTLCSRACGALHAVRDQLYSRYSRLDAITTGAFGQLMYDDEPLDTALLGLLGDNRDNYWGEQATAAMQLTRVYGLSW